jgi:hypothetical protein
MTVAIALLALAVSVVAFAVNFFGMWRHVFERQMQLRGELRELLYQLQDVICDQPADAADFLSTAPRRLNRIARTLDSPGPQYINEIVDAVTQLRATWTGPESQRELAATQRDSALVQIDDCITAISDIEKDLWMVKHFRYRRKLPRARGIVVVSTG